MNVTFLVTGSKSSSEGYTRYSSQRKFSCVMNYVQLREMHYIGEWDVDGKTISIDYEGDPTYTEVNDSRVYQNCTIMIDTSNELDDPDDNFLIYDSEDLNGKGLIIK